MAADKTNSAAEGALALLRLEIDAIDNAIHDLLMNRAEIVDRVATAKGTGTRKAAPLFRAGREASILRRLVARNRAPLPTDTVIGVWREIITSLTRFQGDFVIAAYAPEGVARYAELAGGHFGCREPLLKAPSIAAALAAVAKGRAQLAVLPLPGAEPRAERGWWRRLGGAGSLTLLARLPFAGSSRAPDAVIVGRQAFDASGDDRGYVLVETRSAIGRARLQAALKAAGLTATGFPAAIEEKVARGGKLQYQLVETSQWVAANDPRLHGLATALGGATVRSLGGYARPLVSKRK
jgi:chorismate mutase / prephenate dehydratase